MRNFKKKISVIVPIYNSENDLERSLNSLIRQSMDKDDYEIILINDGSEDGSLILCMQYGETFDFISVITQENAGVSKARNKGIKAAKGKYILFLDSDDSIGENTLENIFLFFEENNDKVDLVTYPLYYVRGNKKDCDHFRYDILTEDGVYNIDELPFICQTTMNICVKNRIQDPLFFDEKMEVLEDQDFILRNVESKRNIGYVKNASYYYYLRNDSSSKVKNHPLYTFDQITSYYERLFKDRPSDKYIQALYVYNFSWRLKSDQLFPYHFGKDDFENAKQRIVSIIRHIDLSIIIDHPALDHYHKYYLMKIRNTPLTTIVEKDSVLIYSNWEKIDEIEKLEIVVNNITLIDNIIKIIAYIKAPFFEFSSHPILYARVDGKIKEVELFDSAAGRYKTKIKTNKFYGFSFEADAEKTDEIDFFIKIDDVDVPLSFYFMPLSPINPRVGHYFFIKNQIKTSFDNGVFYIDRLDYNALINVKNKMLENCTNDYGLIRKMALNDHEEIWLYYDCKNVVLDNGLLQFVHDFNIKDGIKRYFVWNNQETNLPDIITGDMVPYIIKFGSLNHKILFLQSEKIITAYIELNNICPFPLSAMPKYADLLTAQIVYLQHGVLHAHVPWKYNQENTRFDKIVVSTYFEIDNLKKNFRINEKDMIKSGMPRLELLNKKIKPKKRILFAPSWRSYLIGANTNGNWATLENIFVNSDYYKEIISFLTSRKLNKILKDNNIDLDFKLHPIFSGYERLFEIKNDRINIVEGDICREDYSLFITDFSSFVFDFVYLKRAIMYFVPDYLQFTAGLASYRELDLKFDEAFGDLVKNSSDAISKVEKIILNDFSITSKYKKRMDNFFLKFNNSSDKIYNFLMGDI